MKFNFEYRTSDNVLHAGEIRAVSREHAFIKLKALGIRPSTVSEAPGLANKLLGKGKRWLAIVLLLLICTVLCVVLFRFKKSLDVVEASTNYEDRGQIYGDPVVLTKGYNCAWTNVFQDVGDCFLAAYAVPGRSARIIWSSESVELSLSLGHKQDIEILESDLYEIAQLKRMINGMKKELREYIEDGGSVHQYIEELKIRQLAEQAIYEGAKRHLRFERNPEVWDEQNRLLRIKGLPMISPEEKEWNNAW